MAKDNGDKKGANTTMLASLAGAAVGAAVGAGAIILSDKKNRKKLEEALEGLKKQGFDVLDIVSKEASSVRNSLENGSKKTAAKPKAKVKSKGKK